MKKEYIAPEVNMVKIHAERMLAGSDPDTTIANPNGETDTGFADARESFGFEEISEEE